MQGKCNRRDRAGNGEERKKEMGSFPLGLSQVSAAKFSRMGKSLHRVLGVGAKLLPATTQQGQDHHAAVRALAFKWIRVVFRCWKDGVAYDESRAIPYHQVIFGVRGSRRKLFRGTIDF
jgi:hypothetical protein